MNVVIDGVTYLPKADIPELTDERLKAALRQLTSMLYFGEKHKSMAHAWEVIDILAPDLAKLAADDKYAAFDFMHPDYRDGVRCL